MTDLARHTPVITPTSGGAWGVYCLACSDAAAEYVPRCKVGDREWPPLLLVAAPEPTPQEAT